MSIRAAPRQPKLSTALVAGLAIFLMLFAGQYRSYRGVETAHAMTHAHDHVHDGVIADAFQVPTDHLHSKPHGLKSHHHPDHNHETPYPRLSAEDDFPLLPGAYCPDRGCDAIKHVRYGIDRPPSPVLTA